MDVTIFILAAVVIIVIIICVLYFSKTTKTNESIRNDADVNLQEQIPPRREAVAVAGARRRTGRARLQRTTRDDSDEDEEGFEHVALPEGKIGAKKMRKLQEKEEKRKMREAELEEREERKVRDKLLEEQRLKEERRKEAEEKEKEEQEKKLKEEEEERQNEEYLKLKAQFQIEEEGIQQSDENTESLLQSFIDYIQEMKVVLMEDLASHFKLRTQDVIDRIKSLQEEERLSGVLDDRGKFIYITREEYEAVAKFIKQRGRVSITELAEFSNKLINLNPDNQDTHSKLVSECVA